MAKPKHVFQLYIRTTPEQLWEAITDAKFTSRYFHSTHIDSEWTVGAQVNYRNAGGGVVVEGEVLEVDKPRRLSFSWHVLYDEVAAKQRPTRVTWEIEQIDDACKLTLTHDEFESETELYKGVGEGWPAILSSLKSLLETGEPLSVAT